MQTTFLGFVARTDERVGGHLYLRDGSRYFRLSRVEKADKPTVVEFQRLVEVEEDIRGMRVVPGLVFIDVLSATPFSEHTINAFGAMITQQPQHFVFERAA